MANVFLSYASQDRDKARALAGALGARGLAIWWDRQIGPGQGYDDVIERELRAAAIVLVLWSRHSVASRWVKDEADLAARRGTLVPVLIEPVEPPLGLRRRQAFDLTRWDGKPDQPEVDALYRFIRAKVSPVPAPAPAARKPARDKRLLPLAALSLAALVLAAASLGYWDAYEREHVEHYANVTKRWGLPEGIGRLQPEQVRARNVSLAFVRQGRFGSVKEIRAVNGDGVYPPEFAYRPVRSMLRLNPVSSASIGEMLGTSRIVFERDAAGRVLRQAAFSRDDRLVYALQYVKPDLVQYQLDSALPKAVVESGVTHLKFVRPDSGADAGLDRTVRYLGSDGQPRPDREGGFGQTWGSVNSLGLPTRIDYLGPDGQPAPQRDGVASIALAYTDDGSVTSVVNLDAKGRRVVEPASGVAEVRFVHDRHGNVAETAFYGAGGQLTVSPLLGAAVYSAKFDEQGRVTENSFFGSDRQPVISRLGFARQTVSWQGASSTVEKLFGPDGKPMLLQARVASLKGRWDAKGRMVEAVMLDQHGRPTLNASGCARQTRGYDQRGNLAEIACFNEDGQPVHDTDGDWRMQQVFDDNDNAIESSYFRANGEPGRYGESYAKVRRAYNQQSKPVEVAFFDAAGRPVKTRDGYAKERLAYGPHGEVVEAAYFDEAGRPVAYKGLYARLVAAYDEGKRLVERAVYDEQGNPAKAQDGVFRTRFGYDERGYQTSQANFDRHGSPMRDDKGCARWRLRYNGKGQQTETACLDEHEAASASNKLGWSKARNTFDAQGRRVRVDYLDPADRPVRSAKGIASVRFHHDELGRQIKTEAFDVDGAPLPVRVAVEKVEPGSEGARAGLLAGDVLASYDGQAVLGIWDYRELELVRGERPRQLLVQRAGRMVALEAPAGRLTGVTVDLVAAR